MLREAIERYHDMLTVSVAHESRDMLRELQVRRGLVFGDRPLCTVLRPRFMSPEGFAFLQAKTRLLMRAFDRVYQPALADREFRRQFYLTPEESELVEVDPGFSHASPTSRLDAFFVSEQELKFTEYNAETPAAAAYQDSLTSLFDVLPITRLFREQYRTIPLPAKPGVFHVLLGAFREWSKSNEKPQIGILDWREVPTYSEFLLFQEYFRAQGIACEIVDPREVEYRDGKLMSDGFHITLIYKRVLINELLERCGVNHPVIQAVREGAVCMVNPFRCKILYKKASFAVLSDERNRALLSKEEATAVDDHIPWTRVVEERKTAFRGKLIDLVPFVLEHRESLVLKPNDDYGGKGIVLGWTVDSAAWEHAVQAALKSPYVVQEKIRLPREPFPSFEDQSLRVIDRMLDTAPFICNGGFVDSCLTRISTDDLLNVTAGGGSTAPTMIVEPRP